MSTIYLDPKVNEFTLESTSFQIFFSSRRGFVQPGLMRHSIQGDQIKNRRKKVSENANLLNGSKWPFLVTLIPLCLLPVKRQFST